MLSMHAGASESICHGPVKDGPSHHVGGGGGVLGDRFSCRELGETKDLALAI